MVGDNARQAMIDDLAARSAGLEDEGLYEHERVIASAQSAHVELAPPSDTYGYGMASVRLICGTQTVHRELEGQLSGFLGTGDTILNSSCFDANGGLFETILDEQDCVISDALNHASIIDGIRLSKARRLRFDNNDMVQLEQRLQEASDARYRLIATDDVFSMDGVIVDLASICELADRHDAMVMVDDSHAVGFVGPGGRGTPAHCGGLDVGSIITHRFPVDRFEEAFGVVEAGECGKVVLDWA